MNTQTIQQAQAQILEAQQANGPQIIGSMSSAHMQTSAPVQTTPIPQNAMGFESVAPAANEVTLGKNFVCDRFEVDTDTPPEDLYEDEFLNDLNHDKFVKIDDNVEMMVIKEDNEIFFRKMNAETGKLDGEYTMKLGPGELEKVILEILAVKEGIKSDVSLNSSNGVGLRIMKNCKEQFVVSITTARSVVVNMLSNTSALLRKIMYIILYAIDPPQKSKR